GRGAGIPGALRGLRLERAWLQALARDRRHPLRRDPAQPLRRVRPRAVPLASLPRERPAPARGLGHPSPPEASAGRCTVSLATAVALHAWQTASVIGGVWVAPGVGERAGGVGPPRPARSPQGCDSGQRVTQLARSPAPGDRT